MKYLRLMFIALVILALGSVVAVAAAAPKADSPIVAKCKADLAKRLKIQVKEITLVSSQPVTWPDAALGIPEPGKMYIQVLTPGTRVILDAKKTQYLYTTGPNAIKYGGPVGIWPYSLLYTEPIANEPNLNRDLYQCSLIGTNAVRIASAVSDFYPQEKGALLYTERTSRSGFDLYYLKVGKNAKPMKIYSAFAFGSAALNDSQNKWAAIVRPGLGLEWKVVVSPLSGDKTKEQVFPVPDELRFGQIAWSGDKLMIMAKTDLKRSVYEMIPSAEKPEWKAVGPSTFPGPEYMLNKSQTLEITDATIDSKSAVEIAKVWFTGDRDVLAHIDNMKLKGYDFLGNRYPIVWGEKNSKPVVYTVDMHTKELIAAAGVSEDVKPWAYPPVRSPLAAKK